MQQITSYIGELGEHGLTKTHGRREVAYLNATWNYVTQAVVDCDSIAQPLLDTTVNNFPCRAVGHEEWYTSLGRMQNMFAG